MNHRELIAGLTSIHGAGEARAIVRLVAEERFGLSQTDLLLGKDTQLSADDRAEWEKIALRLLNGEPVQYVLGYADFCGHRFRVTPAVLIPRPETERIVEVIHPSSLTPQPIIDLCTGSGCIAISLALSVPDVHVIGVDISAEALAVARENAAALGAQNVTFLQGDVLRGEALLEDLQAACLSLPRFSVITANPPYVRTSEAAEISATVLDYEPHLALFVPDDDPLRFYRAIIAVARRCLVPEGTILVEINAALADATRRLFLDSGFTDIKLHNDQFGRPRILQTFNNKL